MDLLIPLGKTTAFLVKKRKKPSEQDDLPPLVRQIALIAECPYRETLEEREELLENEVYDIVENSKYVVGVLFEEFLVIAVRGTDVSDVHDIAADANIVKGKRLKHTYRYIDAIGHITSIMGKYEQPVILTGHSLGGALVMEIFLTMENKIDKVYVFNPGVGLKSIPINTKIEKYFIQGDFISTLGINSADPNVHVVKKKKSNCAVCQHTINNFT